MLKNSWPYPGLSLDGIITVAYVVYGVLEKSQSYYSMTGAPGSSDKLIVA
jgi:hypothetical protein